MALTSVRRYLLSALAAAFLACGPALAQTYSANLGPMPLDAANKPNVLGHGEATASWDGKTLSVTGSFAGLSAPATQAHLYLGPYIGVPGTEDFDLTVTPGAAGTVSGQIALNAKEAADFRTDKLYAVTTGTQGGSPVQKPSTMLQEVHRSQTGQAVYVFALPKQS